MTLELRVQKLIGEMGGLAEVTRQHAWADDDQNCKIIGMSEYIRALTVAIILAKNNPSLDMPTPGADPEGFLWLTYVDGPSRGLALELRPGIYKWTQSCMGDKRTFQSKSLNDVAEGFRTTFSKSSLFSL